MINTPCPDERERLRTAIRCWGQAYDIRPSRRGPLFGAWIYHMPYVATRLQKALPDVALPIDGHSDWNDVLYRLTPGGIAFFLPGILLHLLEGGPGNFGDSMILEALMGSLGFLDIHCSRSREEQAYNINAVKACLTPGQRAIMADFAEWLHKALDEEDIGYESLSEGFRAAWVEERDTTASPRHTNQMAHITELLEVWNPVQTPSWDQIFGRHATDYPNLCDLLRNAMPGTLPVDDHPDWIALFSILTPAGLAHFLPALLRHVLRTYRHGDVMLPGFLSFYGYGAGRNEHDCGRGVAMRIDDIKLHLTSEQRGITADFAEWLTIALAEEGIGYDRNAEGFRAAWPKETYDNLSAKKAPVP